MACNIGGSWDIIMWKPSVDTWQLIQCQRQNILDSVKYSIFHLFWFKCLSQYQN